MFTFNQFSISEVFVVRFEFSRNKSIRDSVENKVVYFDSLFHSWNLKSLYQVQSI